MLVVGVVGFYWVVGLVAVVFVLVLVGAVWHLLVYVGSGLDFLDYFVYLFALGGDVAVPWIHPQVLSDWSGFRWFFSGFLHLLSLYLHCFRALVERVEIDPPIFYPLKYLMFSLFYFRFTLSLNFYLMWSSNLHLILIRFLLLCLYAYFIAIIKSILFDFSILAFICCLSTHIWLYSMPFLLVALIVVMEAIFWFLLDFIDLLQYVVSFLLALSLFLWIAVHFFKLVLEALKVFVLLENGCFVGLDLFGTEINVILGRFRLVERVMGFGIGVIGLMLEFCEHALYLLDLF